MSAIIYLYEISWDEIAKAMSLLFSLCLSGAATPSERIDWGLAPTDRSVQTLIYKPSQSVIL